MFKNLFHKFIWKPGCMDDFSEKYTDQNWSLLSGNTQKNYQEKMKAEIVKVLTLTKRSVSNSWYFKCDFSKPWEWTPSGIHSVLEMNQERLPTEFYKMTTLKPNPKKKKRNFPTSLTELEPTV
jgi:hypothetical protein